MLSEKEKKLKTSVYLDGELVDNSVINPKLHTYIGMFRPIPPIDCGYYSNECLCGALVMSFEKLYEHYLHGHFDRPQYKTMKDA